MIKIGEFVRTKGEIFKYNGGEIDTDNEIVKHSKSLIDLLEIGDYLNGKEILSIIIRYEDSETIEKEIKVCTKKIENWEYYETFKEKDINTILTHEKYAANCYKVKGE